MRRTLIAVITTALLMSVASFAQQKTYQPNWNSINARPTPPWYSKAKFGIFVVWGLYSVPAYAPPARKDEVSYAEWYWHQLTDHDPSTVAFHDRVYGETFKYQDFVSLFTAKLWKPDQWATLFAESGARYVVFTAKFHDGYCLWPSAQSWNWNSVDLEPHRDLVGDLTKAVEAHGLRMGLYYSLYEWYNPLYLRNPHAFATEHMIPQMKDLVSRYHPSVLWTDGDWEQPSSVWNSTKFLAWLFNDSPVKDEAAVNDRWGKETRCADGGFYTVEYGNACGKKVGFLNGRQHIWEANLGMGKSYGYNRMETAEDYKTATQLIYLLINCVSRGGNLLLDVGPAADGRIPVIMQERLLKIGQWLKVNGEAIYGTTMWRRFEDGPGVRYTQRGNAVYAITLRWPGKELVLTAPKPATDCTVTLLGTHAILPWHEDGGKFRIKLPPLPPQGLDTEAAYAFKLFHVK